MSTEDESTSGFEKAKERATLGQRNAGEVETSTPLAPHVEFYVAGRWYAVDAFCVERVVAEETITRVPGRSKHILGLALIQDVLVPVIDLSVVTGTSANKTAQRAIHTTSRLVVINHGDENVAIRVEEARGIEMLPQKLEGAPDGIIAGETHHQGHHAFHLSPEELVRLGRD